MCSCTSESVCSYHERKFNATLLRQAACSRCRAPGPTDSHGLCEHCAKGGK